MRAIGNADICQEKHIAGEQRLSLTSCVVQAQPTLAQWAAEHPELHSYALALRLFGTQTKKDLRALP
jgi:hypothetical protein